MTQLSTSPSANAVSDPDHLIRCARLTKVIKDF